MDNRFALVVKGLNSYRLARDSFIMLTAGLVSAFSCYLYQLLMGILLPAAEYGTLLSLTSLLVIVVVFTLAVALAIARVTSKFKSEERSAAINHLWNSSFKRTILVGIFAFGLVAGISPFLSNFLSVDNPFYSIVVFSSLLFAFPLSVNWGVMQGIQRFPSLGLSRVLWGFLRPGVGVLLVYLGFGLVGALAALPISYALVAVLTFFLLRNLSQAGDEKVQVVGLRSYVGFTVLAMFAITALTNLDVVLAKHYLSATDAGSYSAISVLGRIAFYATAGIATAMFPKAVESYENGGNYGRLFFNAVMLSLPIVGGICLVYGLFPDAIMHFLFADKYASVAPYLFRYGLGMSFLALAYLAMVYFLSLGKPRIACLLLVGLLMQVVLIIEFHSSVSQLVNIMLVSGGFSLLLMIACYLKVRRDCLLPQSKTMKISWDTPSSTKATIMDGHDQ